MTITSLSTTIITAIAHRPSLPISEGNGRPREKVVVFFDLREREVTLEEVSEGHLGQV